MRIDPRVAAEGVTALNLQELYAHNIKVRDLASEVNQLAVRVREAQKRGPNAKVDAIARKLFVDPPVRYGSPGLQAHINYLYSMTNAADQKLGRDPVARYNTLRAALNALQAELVAAVGSAKPTESRHAS
jgi:hypothetical protein